MTSPEVSTFFERIHREAGVDMRTGVQIVSLDGDGPVTHVTLGDGSKIDADFVIAGIGLILQGLVEIALAFAVRSVQE